MPSSSIAEATPVRAVLDCGVAGGRSRILRQHVPYPFHITQPFYLDAARPDLATLYLQSASGGLYSGDHLELSLHAREGSALAVTTQAATLVHDCRGEAAVQRAHLSLARDSVLLYTPDPLVLFPGAALRSSLEITLAPDAIALCQEGFACHDPDGNAGVFDHIEIDTTVRAPDGRVYATDRSRITGDSLGTPASPLGPFRASGSVLLLGAGLPDPAALQAGIDRTDCFSGIADLPNEIGIAIRLLAPDGGRLARGLALAFDACFHAALGVRPAARRK